MTKGTITRTATTAAQGYGVGGVDAVNSNSFIFTAVEDLGNGLKFTGVIQQRLSPGSGAATEIQTLGGGIPGTQTSVNKDNTAGDLYANLDGAFGSVRVGRFTFLSHSGYNPFASRLISSTSTAAGYSSGNNTLSYSLPTFAGLTASVATTLAVDPNGTDSTALKVVYAAGPVSAQLGLSRGGNASGGTEATNTSVGATYDFGVAKLFATAYTTKAGASGTVGSTTAVTAASGNQIGVSAPMGALTLKASLLNNKKGTAASAVDRASFGVDYALSKRTTFITELATDKQADTGVAKTTNYFVGLAHTF